MMGCGGGCGACPRCQRSFALARPAPRRRARPACCRMAHRGPATIGRGLPTSSGANSRPSFFLYQSMMRPTKGEMSAAPASAHATACAGPGRVCVGGWGGGRGGGCGGGGAGGWGRRAAVKTSEQGKRVCWHLGGGRPVRCRPRRVEACPTASTRVGAHLRKAEEQRHVAVDALLLQHLAGADTLPGGGDLRGVGWGLFGRGSSQKGGTERRHLSLQRLQGCKDARRALHGRRRRQRLVSASSSAGARAPAATQLGSRSRRGGGGRALM